MRATFEEILEWIKATFYVYKYRVIECNMTGEAHVYVVQRWKWYHYITYPTISYSIQQVYDFIRELNHQDMEHAETFIVKTKG